MIAGASDSINGAGSLTPLPVPTLKTRKVGVTHHPTRGLSLKRAGLGVRSPKNAS